MVVEQIIRPTGLLDPEVEVRPVAHQVDDLLGEIRDARRRRGERVLVTTLTKRMAEDLTEYYRELGVRVRYLHSDIDTLERIQIIRDLRRGEFDVLVGINLLREGLDLPEVSLVGILDADKEGFLRSERSLIQTIGRAARNLNGQVLLYADKVTASMKRAIDETNRRREIQRRYNVGARHPPPGPYRPPPRPGGGGRGGGAPAAAAGGGGKPPGRGGGAGGGGGGGKEDVEALDFEQAAQLRDRVLVLKDLQLGIVRKGAVGAGGPRVGGEPGRGRRSATTAAPGPGAAAAEKVARPAASPALPRRRERRVVDEEARLERVVLHRAEVEADGPALEG